MSEWIGLALAFAFGCGYNWLVVRAQRAPLSRAPMGLWVALGCLVLLTIAGCVSDTGSARLALFWHGEAIGLSNHQHAVLYVGKFFVAGGLPMVAGSLWREYVGGAL